jgi:hypothetical protein
MRRNAAKTGGNWSKSVANHYQKAVRRPRWASRREAMNYGKTSATTLNRLMQQGLIVAKKRGTTVIVDLNSVDDYYAGLPQVGAIKTEPAA